MRHPLSTVAWLWAEVGKKEKKEKKNEIKKEKKKTRPSSG
jgi:hypothetical protein